VSMAALATHCTQLTSLRLEQTYVGDDGVQKILSACPLLQELRVAGCSTHSWMLPAEYMFAGLSVSGLSKMAAGKAAGAKLVSLDLSCLAYEQPQEQHQQQVAAATMLLPAAMAAATAAAPAAAAAAAAADAAVGASGAAAVAAAALLGTSPASSSSSSSSSSSGIAADGVDSSSSYSSVASAIARLSLDSPSSSSSSSSNSSRGRHGRDSSCSPGSSRLLDSPGSESLLASSPDQEDTLSPAPSSELSLSPAVTGALPLSGLGFCDPLIPADWCSRLESLSLDWLKVPAEAPVLQGPLQATLRLCSSLVKLSLVGYAGGVDALLVCVADAGASLTRLNLQHSQVSVGGAWVCVTGALVCIASVCLP
jgi:hypothetical protein